jgi:hypothetical protein
LNKYSEEQELDNPYTNERELESIISDGMNLDHLFDEEEEY